MMLGKKLVIFLFIALYSTFIAQEIDYLRRLDIEEVVVLGSKINKEVVPVQVLGGEKLKRLSAHSESDVMRYFSGV